MTTTPSVLQQIQSTIFRFTRMLSSVLQLDVEIVDADLIRVAGTGPYAKLTGQKLSSSARLLKHVIEAGVEKVVIQSRNDPICGSCPEQGRCTECAFIGVPIMVSNDCVGVISVVAFSADQQKRIKEHSREISEYVRYVSNIFVSKIVGGQNDGDDFHKILLTLIENLDQGVMVLDENGNLRLVNEVALKQLNCTQEKIAGRLVTIRPLNEQQTSSPKHLQYIVTFADRQEIIIGQLHCLLEQQVFLMAFHQSHPLIPEKPVPNDPRLSTIIGDSQPMRALKTLITRISDSPSSVLIVSESGTGKEVIARAIHQLSSRSNRPFVAINCASIPEALQESELFGYAKGAFTGASITGKVGLIQSANGGTLFLDEIGDMSLGMQAKLLRAIESREVLPIGSNKAAHVDFRIIAATHQKLEQFIAERKFREDLFYRLNVIPLTIPPLRDRKGDIESLAHYFINLHTKRIGVVYPGISTDVIKLLQQYNWPGNVRELSNLMEYLVNVVPSGGIIDTSLLPPNITRQLKIHLPEYHEQFTAPETPVTDEKVHGSAGLADMERRAIEEALLRHKSKKQVADELGIGIATLYRKLKQYGFKPAE